MKGFARATLKAGMMERRKNPLNSRRRNDGKSTEILKDESITIKPFVLGKDGRQSTKLENLIDSFKLVYIICLLFKVMRVCKPGCRFQGDLFLKWKTVFP